MYTGRPSCDSGVSHLLYDTPKYAEAYLVGLMVVLWIVFEDLSFLYVVETPHKLVHPEILPPFLALYEPMSYQ